MVCLRLACCLLILSTVVVVEAGESSSFRADIRPILSDKCFACHGPDEAERQADLRLDVPDEEAEAIVPGNPDDSELILRITSDDPEFVMPPPGSGKRLSEEEIGRITEWIADGAEYEVHWAFSTPQRPEVPVVQNPAWVRNPIDAFVLRRLEERGLSPAAEADRVTWLRRLSLDLVGLPPAVTDVDLFLADETSVAYDRQIKRLLDSPHYGERWGRFWLDAARYADSDGYEKDKPREMWFYRDWVIGALNEDLPYDEFIVQQVAGDLLPDPSQAAVVATGFLRNSMVNEEGGADPEQFRMEAMYDRMDAIGKSVLGLTVQCGQCHTHKYDPLSQEEYYGMFAFLNGTHDAIIPVYTNGEQETIRNLHRRMEQIKAELKESMPDWQQQMNAWAESQRATRQHWQVLEPDEVPFEGQKFKVLEDGSILSQSFAPITSSPEFVVQTDVEGITGFRLELLTHPLLPRRGPGRSSRGTAAVSEMKVFVAPVDEPQSRTEIKLVAASADVNPVTRPQPDYLRKKNQEEDQRVVGAIDMAIDGKLETAWTTDNDPGRRNQSRKAVFVPESPVGFTGGTRITFQPVMRHGGWNNNDNHNCLLGRYRFSLTTEGEPVADPLSNQVRRIVELEATQRTASEQSQLFDNWLTTVAAWKESAAELERLWQRYPEGTTQLVLEERISPRVTNLLERGDFLNPVRPVDASVPEFLHHLEAGDEPARLRFARWLVDRRSPTTARAIVNRIWQSYFGMGIVETSDDLGSQGTPPSHPELLDWLAVELMDHDWSLKHVHELITQSATYRQSSHVSLESLEQDPYNRLLGRGPRFRVDAEIVRDITLSVSGLLNPAMGGPSVHPPAPRFLFDPPASYGPKTWDVDGGADRYRRALYTFRFRSVPYPMLETFDAVPGNVSCVRRNRSNTPLQALTSLNEPLQMECSRALASLALLQGGVTDEERIVFVFRRCVSRPPDAAETLILKSLLAKQRQRITDHHLDAAKVAFGSDAQPSNEATDVHEQAAWTLLARVVLNLDETITKE